MKEWTTWWREKEEKREMKKAQNRVGFNPPDRYSNIYDKCACVRIFSLSVCFMCVHTCVNSSAYDKCGREKMETFVAWDWTSQKMERKICSSKRKIISDHRTKDFVVLRLFTMGKMCVCRCFFLLDWMNKTRRYEKGMQYTQHSHTRLSNRKQEKER